MEPGRNRNAAGAPGVCRAWLELAGWGASSGVLLADVELRALRPNHRAYRPHPAASSGAPAPCVRVPDTGRKYARPGGAGPCRGKGRRSRPADGILQKEKAPVKGLAVLFMSTCCRDLIEKTI